jgi:hypothetical protein
MIETLVELIEQVVTFGTTAFKCAGGHVAQVEKGGKYYIDPHALPPDNYYCERCAK